MKILSGWIFLTEMSLLNGICSMLAPKLYGIKNDIIEEILLMVGLIYLLSLLYFFLGAMLAIVSKGKERGMQMAYIVLFLGYLFSVLYDMDVKFEFLRGVTPFRYFKAEEIISGKINVNYLLATGILCAVFYIVTVWRFQRKDL